MLAVADLHIHSKYSRATSPGMELETLSKWAGLRNILAHEYIDLRWESIKKFIDSAEPVFVELCEKIKSLLKT